MLKGCVIVNRSLRRHGPNFEVVLRDVALLALRVHGHQPALLVALPEQDGQLLVLRDGQLVRVLRGEGEQRDGGSNFAVCNVT